MWIYILRINIDKKTLDFPDHAQNSKTLFLIRQYFIRQFNKLIIRFFHKLF